MGRAGIPLGPFVLNVHGRGRASVNTPLLLAHESL